MVEGELQSRCPSNGNSDHIGFIEIKARRVQFMNFNHAAMENIKLEPSVNADREELQNENIIIDAYREHSQ